MNAFLSAIIALIINTIVSGIVVSNVWGWFAVPLGVMDLTVAHAMGIRVLVGVLTYSANLKQIREVRDEDVWPALGWQVYTMFFFMFIAWVIHLFAF